MPFLPLLSILSYLTLCLAVKPLGTPHYRDYFFVGSNYVPNPTPNNINATEPSLLAQGQLYVEHLTPANGVTKTFPILFVHGAGVTGTCFLNTPDGRLGWADWFMGQGYEVVHPHHYARRLLHAVSLAHLTLQIYLVDQPSRGRSAWHQGVDGPQNMYDTYTVEMSFTATRQFPMWPNATLQTKWPGNGTPGDPIFDRFYPSMVPFLSDRVESAERNQRALVSLVDRIGVRDFISTLMYYLRVFSFSPCIY